MALAYIDTAVCHTNSPEINEMVIMRVALCLATMVACATGRLAVGAGASTRASDASARLEATGPCRERAPCQNSRWRQLRGGSALSPLETELELEVALDEAGDALVVVDFFAEWCGPCKKIAPTLEQLARSTPPSKVLFYKVDVDRARELAAAQGVKSMPTLQFFKGGKKVHEIVGGDIPAIKREVQKATAHPLLRHLSSDKLLACVAALYLLIPWQKLQYA